RPNHRNLNQVSTKMPIKRNIQRLVRSVGYDISKFTPLSHPIARRKRMLDTYGIDTVMDVGANAGQFARKLRSAIGYTGRILSFEPVTSAFDLLRLNAKGDPKWEVFKFALGDSEAK